MFEMPLLSWNFGWLQPVARALGRAFSLYFFIIFSFSFVICRVTDILFQLSCPRRQVQLCNLNLRSQHQLFFPPQFHNDTNRLRNFMDQPDVSGVASFVAKCLALFP